MAFDLGRPAIVGKYTLGAFEDFHLKAFNVDLDCDDAVAEINLIIATKATLYFPAARSILDRLMCAGAPGVSQTVLRLARRRIDGFPLSAQDDCAQRCFLPA
jgi:hypothetical protein